MAHRVHPKIFRVKGNKDWNSRWLAKKGFARYLSEDFAIREFLSKELKEAGVNRIEIERFPGKTNVIVESSRPGIIIGRGGKGIEELKKRLESVLLPAGAAAEGEKGKKKKREIKLEIKEVRDPWKSANLAAQWIASQLERRIHFRRALKQCLDKIMFNKEVKGARVEISGRLGGAEIARREWLKKGRLPRQTIRADIDYGTAEARCPYGVIGVKVWIYKGERFDGGSAAD